MNVLFALYGDLSSNSSIPMSVHARELERKGHRCAVAIPHGVEGARMAEPDGLRVHSYEQALASPRELFGDGRLPDILHAWTPRENVRRFSTSFLSANPVPLVIYLEDNEDWIGRAALAMVGLREEVLFQHTEEVISTWTPLALAHPLRYRHFVGLADGAVVIQDKLAAEVPPWMPCATVMPGVDLGAFGPREADPAARARHGVAEGDRVIVYPGGLNDFTRPGLRSLCEAVVIINRRGVPCTLLRSGPVGLDFLDDLPAGLRPKIIDLGALPRDQLPALLSLADVFVQPGTPSRFEDLRLPGKLPELFATGRPVVLPDTNIASMLSNGVNAVIMQTGSAEEIAEKCLALFRDPDRARSIGLAGRAFARAHFDPQQQAAALELRYRVAIEDFDPAWATALWAGAAAEPVDLRLARKLRLLASRGTDQSIPAAALLEEHARGLEFLRERSAGLEAGMAVRDATIASLQTGIAERDATIALFDQRLAGAIEAHQAEARALHASIARLGAEANALRAEIAAAEARAAALESSLSWRLTRPFRMAVRAVLRLTSRHKPERS